MDRQEKMNELTKKLEGALDELHQELEAGRSEGLIRYLAAMARFPDYSFRNVMLIVSQFPPASEVCGYRAWQKLGRQVKKGEKAIKIVAPMAIRREAQGDEEPESMTLFRAVNVFDILQTEGEELPELGKVSGDPGAYRERLERFLEGRGIRLEVLETLGGALGRSTGGTIELVAGLAPAEAFSVLVHETAHELLHHGEKRETSKTVRETEAEAVAFVVSSAVGLETNHASADYIQLYQGDGETFHESLENIHGAALEILGALNLEELEQAA